METVDLLLVTAVLRSENLIYIAKSIVDAFNGESDVKPFWIMCIDKFHSDITPLRIKRLEVFCLEHQLPYAVYYQGEDSDANYGGALMNAPLQDLKNKIYPDSNPYVYVLDDDNIVSPNLIKFMHEHVLPEPNVKAWWLNMLDEFGAHRFVRYADRLASIPGTGCNKGFSVIHPCASCDPSQLLIHLDALLELGGFGKERAYDYAFMNCILRNKNNIDTEMKHQGTYTWLRDANYYVSSYHNGLTTPDMIKNTLIDLGCVDSHPNEYDDSYIHVHVGKNMYNIPLSKDTLINILNEIKKEDDRQREKGGVCSPVR